MSSSSSTSNNDTSSAHQEQHRTTTADWWIDFAAGWVSGAVAVVACQPLDTVLTRYQAGFKSVSTNAAATANGELIAGLRGITKEFGVLALWRGSSPMIGVVPFQNALLMGGYGIGKQYSESDSFRGTHGVLFPVFVGGCVGGILQSFLVSPLEWIKVSQQTRLQSSAASIQATTTTTTASLARELVHNKALWNRGLAATLLRDGFPHGVWFASYEYSKTELHRVFRTYQSHNQINTPPKLFLHDFSTWVVNHETVSVPLLSGAFAATCAWAVGYPFDLVKTRIQATKVLEGSNKNSVPGVVETIQQLVAESNGQWVRGLYRGFGWKLVRSIPASMIGFLVYENVSEELKGRLQSSRTS